MNETKSAIVTPKITDIDENRAGEIFRLHLDQAARKTDQMFCLLFIFQWILGIIFALFISPKTWSGSVSETHIHVYAAVFLGGLTALFPILLILTKPDEVFNRYIVSISQILFSILFIHLTGGRIETHFHVFGSLALLAFYYDWKYLAIATAITAADHLVRGFFWPQSVYGVLSTTPWRAIEHAAWVLFEDVFLFISSQRALDSLRAISRNQVVLENALAMAEGANAAKSTFLANMSHELRTPMHGILSYARFGQKNLETATKEKIKSYFDEIYDSGSRLMNLLNDLLDLSKLEAGKMTFSMKTGDLRAAADMVRSELSALAEEKGIDIQLRGTDDTSEFDQEKIMQVMRNLLSNAIKFAQKGSSVRMSVIATNDSLRFQIGNRGVGVPDNELETIFDKFVQGSNTRTGAGGTGLGLAICKEIIEQHGGRTWAENGQDGETLFIFEIPRTIPVHKAA